MDNTSSKRKHGGLSRSLDFLISSIKAPPAADSENNLKAVALLDLSTALHAIIEQTEMNDADCGYFLAELTSFLSKNSKNLALENRAFSDCIAKWKPVRAATSKNSALRRKVHQVILNALSRRRRYGIASFIPGATEFYKQDAALMSLPDFRDQPEVVDQWFNAVVYPELRKRRDELEQDPGIGKLKRARDENGKFQVSRLKDEMRAIAFRIAKLPKSYYFLTS